MIDADILVFARCAGFISRAPGFSHQSVPPPIRAGIAFMLAVGISPSIHDVEPRSGIAFIVEIVLEIGLGVLLGFAASVLFDGASSGGRLLDNFVGMQGVNPSADVTAGDGFGRLWGITFVAAFFFLDGYQVLIQAFVDSLQSIPPGVVINHDTLMAFALALPTTVVRAAILVAGPAIALGFVVQIALGTIARIVPKFQNITLSFPLMFAAVLLTTIVTLPTIIGAAAHPWMPAPFGTGGR